ncbi:MAG: hypothetical protein Q3983_03780 [Capnocytophaga sp.]|nr:hypothetical protein [Capnocytophaga sp.]
METEVKILNDSKRRIQKLKIFENFFKQADLLSIVVRTEIIHSFFEKNKENLDLNQLELFHLQYTDSLSDLLRKIKKQKETSILNLETEINASEAYIAKNLDKKQQDDFDLNRKYHNAEVSQVLDAVYNTLTGVYKPFNINSIRSFPNLYAEEYFREEDDITHLLAVADTKFYVLENIKIERLLLSRLAGKNFKVRFVCGYDVDNQVFELFRILGSEDEFIWNLQTNSFYLLKEGFKHQLNRQKNVSKSNSLWNELEKKIISLKEKQNEIRNSFPEDVKDLLKKYKQTIENNNLTEEKLNIDEEKNILHSMLDLNINKK